MTEKQFWVTTGRERNIVRFSEKSDQKDACPPTKEEFLQLLQSRQYNEYQANKFTDSVEKNVFNDWTIY